MKETDVQAILELRTAPLGNVLEDTLNGTLPRAIGVVKHAVAAVSPRCLGCGGDMRLQHDRIYLEEEYAVMGEQGWRCSACGDEQTVPYRAYYLFS